MKHFQRFFVIQPGCRSCWDDQGGFKRNEVSIVYCLCTSITWQDGLISRKEVNTVRYKYLSLSLSLSFCCLLNVDGKFWKWQGVNQCWSAVWPSNSRTNQFISPRLVESLTEVWIRMVPFIVHLRQMVLLPYDLLLLLFRYLLITGPPGRDTTATRSERLYHIP